MCCCDGDCRPLGWLLGLPFALLAVLVSLVGAIIWIVGWVPWIFSPLPSSGRRRLRFDFQLYHITMCAEF
jgi:hypothetical protein